MTPFNSPLILLLQLFNSFLRSSFTCIFLVILRCGLLNGHTQADSSFWGLFLLSFLLPFIYWILTKRNFLYKLFFSFFLSYLTFWSYHYHYHHFLCRQQHRSINHLCLCKPPVQSKRFGLTKKKKKHKKSSSNLLFRLSAVQINSSHKNDFSLQERPCGLQQHGSCILLWRLYIYIL